MKVLDLGCHFLSDNAEFPVPATTGSACFDLRACLWKNTVKIMDVHDCFKRDYEVFVDSTGRKSIVLPFNYRILVPTGIIFTIPEGYQIKIVPRSGYAWKNSITIPNSPATIDCDYVEETFVMLQNNSSLPFIIEDGMRVAQGELVKTHTQNINWYSAVESHIESIKYKHTRDGGFGHTGTK
jgi:dUTP pyrophosphatase